MTTRFWLQTQAPAGNWTDNMGSANKDDCIRHGGYLMRENGATVRVVERVDTTVWTALPMSISLDQLIAAFARGGYAYKREEFRGTQMGGERCELLRHHKGGAVGVYAVRVQADSDGRWEAEQVLVSFNAQGELVAEH